MDTEDLFVTAFIRPEKQDRYRQLLGNPKRRRKILEDLAHSSDFMDGTGVKIPPSEQTPEGIERLLRRLGAGSTCHAISENGDLDGKELDLQQALQAVVGFGLATCLSCIPGKLGYYEGEDMGERMILRKK